MKQLFFFLSTALFLSLTSCGGWNDDRKNTITAKCDGEIYNCDCFLQKTIETFPDPEQYNAIMENESANQEKIDAYWKGLEGCMK